MRDQVCVNGPLTLPLPFSPFCSLARNQLCGLDGYGNGEYTTEGITKLCEALKESAVTSLKCAAAPECSPYCQRGQGVSSLEPECPQI